MKASRIKWPEGKKYITLGEAAELIIDSLPPVDYANFLKRQFKEISDERLLRTFNHTIDDMMSKTGKSWIEEARETMAYFREVLDVPDDRLKRVIWPIIVNRARADRAGSAVQ
jgi:hypothetical protein